MSEPFLERLEMMTHAQKVRHWSGQSPWLDDGRQTRFPAIKFVPIGHIGMDDDGHITRSPEIIGRPCFGQIAAYVRHGDLDFVKGYQGQWVPTRCGRCPAKIACKSVCERRIAIVPSINSARAALEALGGAAAMRQSNYDPRCWSAFHNLTRAIEAHGPFESVNDPVVRAHLAARREQRLADDARRKKIRRKEDQRAALRKSEVSPEMVALLERERFYRVQLWRRTRKFVGVPHSIRQSPPSGAEFDADVWWAKTTLELTGKKANPSSIARYLIDHRAAPDNHNALRSRVYGALQRVQTLETRRDEWGNPFWERFSCTQALKDIELATHGLA